MTGNKQIKDAMISALTLEAREQLLKEIDSHTPWKGDIQVHDSYGQPWYHVIEIAKDNFNMLKVRYDSDGSLENEHLEILSFDQLYEIAMAL